jgi:hypothetical protein
MAAIDWVTVENQLWTWVQTKSGLAAERVFWTSQNSPRPAAGPYITLNVRTVVAVGTGWVKKYDNPAPTPENEIIHHARNMQRCTLEVTYWGGDATGVTTGVSVLNTIVESLALPSVSEALTGLGVAQLGPIQHFTGVVGSTLVEPRARMDVIFFTPSELTETGTYVESVEVTRLGPPPVKTWSIP